MSRSLSSPFRDGAAHPLAGLNVLQIAPALDETPLARATIEIAEALTRIGANAFVAAETGSLVSELQARGGVFVRFPGEARDPLRMGLNIGRLARLIQAERIDLAHARSRASAWSALGATRWTRIPFVTSFQSSYGDGGPLALRYNSVMARGDAVIASSSRAAQAAARIIPDAARRAHVAAGGADCRVFAPKVVSAARVQAVRRRWSVPPDARVVLIATGAHPVADCASPLRAVRILGDELSAQPACDVDPVSLRVVVVGEGEDDGRRVDALIASEGLEAVARRVEFGPDRAAALLAASAVIAASPDADAFAALAIEAQAMGAPAIVSAGGAAAETLLAPPQEHFSRRTGWVAAPDDPYEIAACLKEALRLGAAARDRLSDRARAHVEAAFSSQRLETRTFEAYAAALAAAGRRQGR